MNSCWQALTIEFLKARRSRVPLFTALGLALAPLMSGFFMFILKDPEFARRAGILRSKAEMLSGTADWPSFFGMLAQAAALGGFFVFALITSWVFGREFVDRTAKDLLALPSPRQSIIGAKFTLVAVWIISLVIMIYILGLLVGWIVVLPQWSIDVALQGASTMAIVALLNCALVTPTALVASAGRGYLPPVGFAILMVVLAQIAAATGWGSFFPWAVPALYAGLGAEAGNLDAIHYGIVIVTSLAGLTATFAWWRFADQTT